VSVVKVKKILNNNVIVTSNEKNKEVIVMGKGLAFGLKVGDEIDRNRIDKVFSLENKTEAMRFKQLLAEVPEKYLEMSEAIIDYAKEKLGKKLHNSIYITLTDHINTMAERSKFNTYIKNPMLWDVKRLYREEFLVAEKAVEEINQRLGASYDDHEAASIALHFVNAQLELDFSATMNITKVISEILNIVKYHFRITYNEDSLSYYRFVVHLRSFAQRLFAETTYDDLEDIELLQHIQKKYEKSYQCSHLISQYILESYGYELHEEEAMYLTIHIEKVVKNSQQI